MNTPENETLDNLFYKVHEALDKYFVCETPANQIKYFDAKDELAQYLQAQVLKDRQEVLDAAKPGQGWGVVPVDARPKPPEGKTEVMETIPQLKQFALEIHINAANKGWWEKGKRPTIGESIALMHSELSEALESARKGDPPDDKIPEFTGVEAELGDCVIRILDFAEAHSLRVIEAMVAKSIYNKTRPYRHGKQF